MHGALETSGPNPLSTQSASPLPRTQNNHGKGNVMTALMRDKMWRSRWAAIGAALAVGIGGGGVVHSAMAAGGPSSPSSFVAITPCRLFDTRAGAAIGPRSTALKAGDTFTAQVTGTNGKCTIPATATGVALNVTIANPTAESYLTVFPADATQPLSSNLNWTASSSPTPNGVTVLLSATGAASFYNFAGSVDVLADAVGYYVTAATGGGGGGGGGSKVDASSAKRVADITLDQGSRADFLDLSNHGTGPVTLASPGQLVVNTEITLFNQAATGVSSRIECSLEANPGSLAVGTSQIVTVLGANGPDLYVNVSLTGAVAVPAGTYGVDVLCQDILRDGNLSNPRVRSASMTVLAVPD